MSSIMRTMASKVLGKATSPSTTSATSSITSALRPQAAVPKSVTARNNQSNILKNAMFSGPNPSGQSVTPPPVSRQISNSAITQQAAQAQKNYAGFDLNNTGPAAKTPPSSKILNALGSSGGTSGPGGGGQVVKATDADAKATDVDSSAASNRMRGNTEKATIGSLGVNTIGELGSTGIGLIGAGLTATSETSMATATAAQQQQITNVETKDNTEVGLQSAKDTFVEGAEKGSWGTIGSAAKSPIITG
jgi:hypothetical protein